MVILGSKHWFCIKESMLKLMFVGVSSGSSISPLRNCITCLIVGLLLIKGCVHNNPNFRTRHALSIL
uniref:Uncharacterized protein n=1 Tax=Oryza brachyantha TaxID=4533 RepID=J3MID8_ORYBR